MKINFRFDLNLRTYLTVILCTTGLLASISADSFARSFRVNDVPNFNSFSCLGCHDTYPPSGNNFGLDAWRSFSPELARNGSAHVVWRNLYNLDSDGDGFTNGEELGDPYGEWTTGAVTRYSITSDPSDPNSRLFRSNCGNGAIDTGEDCDGENLNGYTCVAFGYFGGDLSCRSSCFLELSECVGDSDQDGIGDDVDNCLNTPNTNQIDHDQDGLGDVCDDDLDGDGILNSFDNCPRLVNPTQEDLDQDGIGDFCDPDADGDGIEAPIEAMYNMSDRSTDSDQDGISDQEEFGPDPVNPIDTDGDGVIDAVDLDSDEDGVNDDLDNCRIVANPDQADGNENGQGDACDPLPVGGVEAPVAGDSIGGNEPLGGTDGGMMPLAGTEAMAGEAMAGEAMEGEAMAGEAMAGEAMAGEAMAGEAMAGEPMTGEPKAGEEEMQAGSSENEGTSMEVQDSKDGGCQQRQALATPLFALFFLCLAVCRRNLMPS